MGPSDLFTPLYMILTSLRFPHKYKYSTHCQLPTSWLTLYVQFSVKLLYSVDIDVLNHGYVLVGGERSDESARKRHSRGTAADTEVGLDL